MDTIPMAENVREPQMLFSEKGQDFKNCVLYLSTGSLKQYLGGDQ